MCRASSSASSRPDGTTRAFRTATAVLAASAALLLLYGAGCGYHLKSEGQARFSDPAVRMNLAPFQNDSTEADAGAYVAGRLREELRRSGFRGSFGSSGANYLVEGKVQELVEDVFSHGSDRFALEKRLTLAVDIRVIEVRRGTVLWKAAGLRETASYFSGPDAQYTQANRRTAFEEVTRRLVVRIAQTISVVL